jgi:hypothetical protein
MGYIYIYTAKSKPPKLDDFRSLKRQTLSGRVDQPGCCDVRSPSRCRQTTLAAPFIPRRKTLLVGYIYMYVYVGLYMCIWGL